MISRQGWPIGVCSWSLGRDIEGVRAALKELGVEHVHLAIRPGLEEKGAEYVKVIQKAGFTITSTMMDFPQEDYTTLESIKKTGGIVPDSYWPRNKELMAGAIELTGQMGVKYLSLHAGFIDEGRAGEVKKMRARLTELARAAEDNKVTLLLETGQETAECLREFLEELDEPGVGVNFDPANMILYDKGNPVEALRVLGRWVKHIHIKDAIRTQKAGQWGREAPWGEGEVGSERFLETLREIGYKGALAIEREAGEDRIGDIRRAIERLR